MALVTAFGPIPERPSAAERRLTPLEDIVLAVLQGKGKAMRAQQVVDTLDKWYMGQSKLALQDVRWILRDLERARRVSSTRLGGWFRAVGD